MLQYLKNDPRWTVKSKALQHLHQLAKPGAHLWPSGAANDFVDVALETKTTKVLDLVLRKSCSSSNLVNYGQILKQYSSKLTLILLFTTIELH